MSHGGRERGGGHAGRKRGGEQRLQDADSVAVASMIVSQTPRAQCSASSRGETCWTAQRSSLPLPSPLKYINISGCTTICRANTGFGATSSCSGCQRATQAQNLHK